MGKYALVNGVSAAAKHFSKKFGGIHLGESTVRSICNAYKAELTRKRKQQEEGDVISLPVKKRGRQLLLGDDLDAKVRLYLKRVRGGGGVVSARIVIAAARGILLSCDKSRLVEYGGPIELNRAWAYSLLRRMDFVKRKASTAKSKYNVSDFDKVKQEFLDEVVSTVMMEEIPPHLILNWDQTGIKIVPSSSWTMDKCGAKRVELTGVDDKRQITAVFCGSLVGDFLPVQLIYTGKTPRCHPKFKFPSGWNITHSPKHWSNEETMIEYVETIIVPYVERMRDGEEIPALVIMDNFKGQITQKVNSLLEENNIHICLLPPNTTDRLQPMDLSVNKPAKEFLRQKFQVWYSERVLEQFEGEDDMDIADLNPISLSMPILKELGAKWLVEMEEYLSNNPQIIVNGFIQSGICGALDRIDDTSDEHGECTEQNGEEFTDGENDEWEEVVVDDQDGASDIVILN